MRVEKQNFASIDIDIVGITLLSIEELEAALNSKVKIPPVTRRWWLRSEGYKCIENIYTAYAREDNEINFNGVMPNNENLGVRPALRVNHETINLKPGDKFRFEGYMWTMISYDLALCDEIMCVMPFRKSWPKNKNNANFYALSDIKAYLETWFETHVKSGEREQKKGQRPLFCIIGRTGSGKSTVARIFEEEFGKKQVHSYTTRPMRPGEEKRSDYIFIRPEEVIKYRHEAVAYAKIEKHEYFSTPAVLAEADTYVVDPIGVADIRRHIKDRPIFEIYVCAKDDILDKHLNDRKDKKEKVESRRTAEKDRFDAYELLKSWDFLIENDGTIEDLRKKVSDIVKATEYTGSTMDRHTGPKPNEDSTPKPDRQAAPRRKVQFYRMLSDELKRDFFITVGIHCEKCGSNVYHHEYDGRTVFLTCDKCGADITAVQPEYTDEFLAKGIWKDKE